MLFCYNCLSTFTSLNPTDKREDSFFMTDRFAYTILYPNIELNLKHSQGIRPST